MLVAGAARGGLDPPLVVTRRADSSANAHSGAAIGPVHALALSGLPEGTRHDRAFPTSTVAIVSGDLFSFRRLS